MTNLLRCNFVHCNCKKVFRPNANIAIDEQLLTCKAWCRLRTPLIRCRQPYILTTRKLNGSLKLTTTTKPALLLRDQIPRSNVGQVAQVSPTPWVTSQEAACWFRLGCWSIKSANNHPKPGAFNCSVLRAFLLLQRSYQPHRSAINDALRIVTRHLRPTPADNLSILAGIQPAELRRNGATLPLVRRAMEPGHLLHWALTCPSSANTRFLKSRHPLVPAVRHLISSSDNNNIRAASGRITHGVHSGRTAPQDSAFSSPTPVSTPRNDPNKKSLCPG